jgi:hypothetical protein
MQAWQRLTAADTIGLPSTPIGTPSMNDREARAYLERRRQIAKDGAQQPKPKPKGPLAPFTANLQRDQQTVAAFRKEVQKARNYVLDGRYRADLAQNVTASEQYVVTRQLEKQLKVAESRQSDLQEIGEYVAWATGTTWIPGPMKLLGGPGADRGAYAKTVRDYALDWSANKDLIRGTIAAKTDESLKSVVSQMDRLCCSEFGFSYLKRLEVQAKKDTGCGYSGWNFVVMMKGSSVAAEIQANTFAMMFGKMSRQEYSATILRGNEAQYQRTRAEMKIEGGLTHLFYEIYQARDTSAAEKELASALSRDYCILARSNELGDERAASAKPITDRIEAFEGALTTPKAREIWGKRAHHA